MGAVAGESDAFVSGVNQTFMVSGFFVVVAMVISFFKGERAREIPAPAQAVPAGETRPD